MRTPTVHRDLPWQAIRRDWEASLITMVSLARKYGVASTTTLSRRQQSEGWKRDAASIRERRATDQSDPGCNDDIGNRGAAGGDPDAGAPQAPPRTPQDRSATAADPASVDELDLEQLLKPHNFRHAVATTHQRALAHAVAVQQAGLLVVRCIQAVLQPPNDDEAAEARALANLQCLIRVNPERDTLAGLLTAGIKAIERGVLMETRALAAHAASSSGAATAERQSESRNEDLREILQEMDPQTLGNMRASFRIVQRKRREREIAAASAR